MFNMNYLFDDSLTIKAKGVMSIIVNAPNSFHITVENIANVSSGGKDTVRLAINELISYGYVERERVQGENGKFEGFQYNYSITGGL